MQHAALIRALPEGPVVFIVLSDHQSKRFKSTEAPQDQNVFQTLEVEQKLTCPCPP